MIAPVPAARWPAVTPADICWVMRTLDRSQLEPPRTNYLGETLNRLANAGWDGDGIELHLVDSLPNNGAWLEAALDGLVTPDRVRLFQFTCWPTASRKTNNQNALMALRIGLDSGAPWIVHLEDDIDVCADFFGSIARWLTDYADPSHHLFTFHTPYSEVTTRHAQGQQSWEYPIRAFYGNQCWAMRREDAVSAADWVERAIPRWKSSKGFDLMLKDWARETWPAQEHFLASCPSFVQHVGIESSLHLGRFHQNQSWLGPNWKYVGRG